MSPHDRRRGGGGGRGGPLPREVTVSKALSYVLRHGAEKEGIKLDAQGYANVADLLSWPKLHNLHVTLTEIQDIVRNNDKQRFTLISVPTPSSSTDTPTSPSSSDSTNNATTYLIRATQGHSIKTLTSTSLSLTPLTPSTAPLQIVHGTFPAAWRLILASGGLKRMGRNHVHFATATPGEDDDDDEHGAKTDEGGNRVISGMRKDASVWVWVDVRRAMEEGGMRFWRSENGVVLTEGDGRGMVGLGVVGRVVQRLRPGKEGGERERVLWEGGRVVGEVVGGEGGKGGGKGGRGGRGGRVGTGGAGDVEADGEVEATATATATATSPTTTTDGTRVTDTGSTDLDSRPGTVTAT